MAVLPSTRTSLKLLPGRPGINQQWPSGASSRRDPQRTELKWHIDGGSSLVILCWTYLLPVEVDAHFIGNFVVKCDAITATIAAYNEHRLTELQMPA